MGKILSAIRKAIDAGQKSRYRLSQETGIDQGQLSRLVHGKDTGMGVENAEKLAKALGLKITVKKSTPKKGN